MICSLADSFSPVRRLPKEPSRDRSQRDVERLFRYGYYYCIFALVLSVVLLFDGLFFILLHDVVKIKSNFRPLKVKSQQFVNVPTPVMSSMDRRRLVTGELICTTTSARIR